jgi:AraC-like DNA-binding protein
MRIRSDATVAAWQPGVIEVFHARYAKHEYPAHTHDAWTLLIVDDGGVSYRLEHREHSACGATVTFLPPYLPHDGRTVGSEGLRKRVLYLDRALFDDCLVGPAADHPDLDDPLLRDRLGRLHDVLASGEGEDLEADSRLALIRDRLYRHLDRRPNRGSDQSPDHGPDRGPDRRSAAPRAARESALARGLRELLDEHTVDGMRLDAAAELLQAHPVQLVRAFSREYGLPPHRYLTGRRVELARRLLLEGVPPADVAVMTGFYDQSHLTRHFKRLVGVSPAYFGRLSSASARRLPAPRTPVSVR